jgi:hypothetical protein
VNRRDIFKMFAAGTIIAPIIDGLPSQEVAKLIEVPRVVPVSLALPSSFPVPSDTEYECVMYMRERSGNRLTYSFDAYLVEFSQTVHEVDASNIYSEARRVIPTYADVTLKISGKVRM